MTSIFFASPVALVEMEPVNGEPDASQNLAHLAPVFTVVSVDETMQRARAIVENMGQMVLDKRSTLLSVHLAHSKALLTCLKVCEFSKKEIYPSRTFLRENEFRSCNDLAFPNCG